MQQNVMYALFVHKKMGRCKKKKSKYLSENQKIEFNKSQRSYLNYIYLLEIYLYSTILHQSYKKKICTSMYVNLSQQPCEANSDGLFLRVK